MARTPRLRSLDVVRGLVMVLMAVDHVRVYSGVPAAGPTPGIFFTRWITHFCAPAFVFFAGTAAFLHGRSRGDTRQLAGYLAWRGLLLVVLELTVLRLAWTFNVERARGPIANVFDLFGRVPLFYYLLHIPLIHTSALVVSYLREGHVNPWLFANHPMMNPPPPRGYLWSLALLYLVLAIDVAILYVPCRWLADVKARSRDRWLRYI